MPIFCLQQADESLDFEEQILEAAKSIAAATSALVKAASAAQRELVAQGKVRGKRVEVIKMQSFHRRRVDLGLWLVLFSKGCRQLLCLTHLLCLTGGSHPGQCSG